MDINDLVTIATCCMGCLGLCIGVAFGWVFVRAFT